MDLDVLGPLVVRAGGRLGAMSAGNGSSAVSPATLRSHVARLRRAVNDAAGLARDERSFEWKGSIMALEQPSGRYNGFFPADGIDVIEKGLPPLPEVITHELMVPIPISYWVALDSAIVVFFYFSELPGRGIQPFVSRIPYYKKSGKWSVKTYSDFTGSGFPFDPVTDSEWIDDLDGSHLVNSSVSKKQAEGEPLMWVATGRASRDVAYVALV